MPVPKKRQSKSKSNIRKANWKKGILNQKKIAITKGKEEKRKFLNKIPQKATTSFDSKQPKQE